MVTLTATVENRGVARGIPTGVVTFSDGAIPLGTAALRHGRARLRVSTLPVGRDPIQAAYAGSAGFGASSSTVLLETIRAGRPRTRAAAIATRSRPPEPGWSAASDGRSEAGAPSVAEGASNPGIVTLLGAIPPEPERVPPREVVHRNT
jgi:hypothetical protein